MKPGTVLYKVLWKGFPPEIATWEDEDCIHHDFIEEYERRLESESDDLADVDSDHDIECLGEMGSVVVAGSEVNQALVFS